jgi:glycosyltransferase involved in cell wall biosynthesis
LISIITAVYNGERFIESCIQTVLKQNFQSAEHVIIDGASNDRTVEIIKRYAYLYPHIRWISEKDKGQSDALNKAIDLARGEILGVLNVDDYYEPGVLNRIEHIFNGLTVPSFVVGNCYVRDDKGKLLYENRPKRLKITDLLLGWSYCPHPVNPSAYFYHKSLHDMIGKYQVDSQIQDLPFILSAVQAANVVYIDEFWGNFRKYDGTLTVKDQNLGHAKKRKQKVMDDFYKKLSLLKKAEMKIKRYRYKTVEKVKNRINNKTKS